ncbi:MAG: response regulator, partial [Chromatiales bacterium]|nr:response regulator [Chromatiales bacterium]
IEAGKIELKSIPFDLEESVFDVVCLLHSKAAEKGIELQFYYSLECPTRFYGDVGRIRQVLVNLVSNAIKFTHHGHVLVSVSAAAVVGKRVEVVIDVEDTGIGIASENRAFLFDAFTQADTSTTRRYGGTGLGLSITKRFIDLMEGRVSVESVEGEGSVFKVELPLLLAAELQRYPREPLQDKSVLIVDDHTVNCAVLTKQLTDAGMQVSTAYSGEEALALLNEATPDENRIELVILDYTLPNIDCMVLADRIRQQPALQDLPLVMLSPLERKGDAALSSQHGFAAYLTKPVRSDTLYSTLTTVLGVESRMPDNIPVITQDSAAETVTEEYYFRVLEGRVLIAENEEVNRLVIGSLLKETLLQATNVVNGEEVLRTWESSHYDLIVMDCHMPVMDGLQVIQEIRRREGNGRRIPIIAAGNDSEVDREAFLAAGADDYLTKPFRRQDLLGMLYKWLVGGETGTSLAVDNLHAAGGSLDLQVLEKLEEAMGGDFGQLIPAYMESMSNLLPGLDAAIQGDDREEIIRCARSIRSASASIGAKILSDRAEQLETQVEDDYIQEQALEHSLHDCYALVKRELLRYSKQR